MIFFQFLLVQVAVKRNGLIHGWCWMLITDTTRGCWSTSKTASSRFLLADWTPTWSWSSLTSTSIATIASGFLLRRPAAANASARAKARAGRRAQRISCFQRPKAVPMVSPTASMALHLAKPPLRVCRLLLLAMMILMPSSLGPSHQLLPLSQIACP